MPKMVVRSQAPRYLSLTGCISFQAGGFATDFSLKSFVGNHRDGSTKSHVYERKIKITCVDPPAPKMALADDFFFAKIIPT